MPNDDTLTTLRTLQRMVPEPAEAHGLVMLLGNGFAEAVVAMRARQAALEFARASALGSSVADARQLEAEAGAAALTAVRAEVRRLRVKQPQSGDGAIGVYGHVLDDGEPVVGAVVALTDDDKALACIETDKAGSFALSVASKDPLGLRVAIDDKVVYRDDEATMFPGAVASYRLVDLADVASPEPAQRPCDDDEVASAPSEPLPQPGQSLTRVLGELKAAQTTAATVRLSAADRTTPQVSRVRGGKSGVTLEVQGRVTDGGRLAVVAAVLAHQPQADAAGIASAAAATQLLKNGSVSTWDEAVRVSRLSGRALTARFGLDRNQGAALRSALIATMSTITIVGEE